MNLINDDTGTYDLEQVIGIEKGGVLHPDVSGSGLRPGVGSATAILILGTGARVQTQLSYETAVKVWSRVIEPAAGTDLIGGAAGSAAGSASVRPLI